MGQTIEQGGRHLGVAEDGCPFAEAEVGGDHHAGPLVDESGGAKVGHGSGGIVQPRAE